MENQGYTIIKIEKYNNNFAICLGKNEAGCFVTWDCRPDTDYYFWGHYFTDYNEAMRDYHTRLAHYYDEKLNTEITIG